ncbi:MAG TPA: M20/M25/M40 family metallo-hydrolase [Terriglobia bacterium]|jgi:acetylornithine deacetylase/succinyl-diaminopimelate desuccinylase-like protein
MKSDIDRYVETSQAEFESKLREWVEIPTVSAEPEHSPDIHRGAEAAVAYLRRLGGDAEAIPTPGNPVVIGKFITGTNRPTVTIYNHLDVQPANEPQWQRAPFVFHKEGNRYIGRGSTDDKGPALTALFGARYALEQGIPVNIQFIWEFEEEIGSPNFEHFLKSKAGDLRTDSIAVSDTIWIARGKPAVAYGLRGLAPVRLVLETGTKDVHSGVTGGATRNPITELCQLISECYDVKKGQVKIPGFYDDVAKLSKAERDNFLASGFSVKEFKRAHELKKMREGDAADIANRIWARPTFEVHGIVGGYTGPGVKTAIPYRAEAKISMRLVPNQRGEKILKLVRKFIKGRNPDVEFIPESVLNPYLGPHTGPHADAARDAMRSAFGRNPAFVREGGSIGAVVTMQKYLKAPIVFLGLSLPEHGYHAPNENFDWEQASGGMKMFAKYFETLSRLPL